jgi:SNF2 family DNA or RNA helicase
MNPSQLIEKYKQLSEFEKDVLRILSVIYEPVSATFMLETLKAMRIKAEGSLWMTEPTFRPFKLSLLKQGFLRGERELACAEDIIEYVYREAVDQPYFQPLIMHIDEKIRLDGGWYYYNIKFERTIRDLRIGFFTGDTNKVSKANAIIRERFVRDYQNFRFIERFFDNPLNMAWLSRFPDNVQCDILYDYIIKTMLEGHDVTEYIAIISKADYWQNDDPEIAGNYRKVIIVWHILRGEMQQAKDLVESWKTTESAQYRLSAWIDMLQGKDSEAIAKFVAGLKLYRKEVHARKIVFEDVTTPYYILSLFRTKNDENFVEAENLLGLATIINITILRSIVAIAKNNQVLAQNELSSMPTSILSKVIYYNCYYWAFGEKTAQFVDDIKAQYLTTGQNNYRYLEMEYANLLAILMPKGDLYGARYETLSKELNIQSISNCVERQEPWMRSLKALSILGNTAKAGGVEKQSRVIWLVDFERKQIQPKEQTKLKSGKWSEGRNIALKRLKQGEVDTLNEQDIQITRALKQNNAYYYGNEYEWEYDQAVVAMIGHPLIFLMNNPTVAVELMKAEPELVINESDKGFSVKFIPPIKTAGVNVVKETATRYQVFIVSEQHIAIAEAMAYKELTIPQKGKEQLLTATKNLTRIVTIHSPLVHHDDEIETIEPDEKLYLQLLPFGEGLRVEVYVKPFGDRPPYSKPGEGSITLMSNVDGKRVQTTRNFRREKNAFADLVGLCPVLEKNDTKTGEWQLDEAEECLQMLLEIEPLKATNKVVLEWPKGEAFRIKYEASFDHLFMKAKKQSDWFNLEGQLRLDENMVLDMRQLIEMVENSPNRFIQLNDGSFMALTKEFRRRLKDISGFIESNKNGMRIHNLATFALDDFAKQINEFDADAQWKKQIKRFKDLPKHNPDVPSTLQADLRNYQVDGYKWLSQLAHLGVGACLADDMGLGKTLQALALILERAPKGPTLVVAPSSVCQNWVNETTKFAPTLNPLFFGRGDRQAMVDELKPFDIMVSSYTMMQQEAEMLSKVQWAVTVLDEAQAIKNYQTKRSKAAMDLNSDFKLITTGTPVENHLGELWNLFNFINPGLLGSAQSFSERFSTPIERYEDKDRRRQLQRLIQPFVLRRRKNQVLEELPQKTEIVLSVELSREETAFYEALRQNAVAKLEGLKENSNEGIQRIQILAEITRLRQAACNSKLVTQEADIPSAKLNLFSEIVDELLENGHKALVFSQFVGHLKIIEQKVQEKKVKYQYLDGSTPMIMRPKIVDAFQRGEGDLFLISLKAGGVGLNLTAADYVIIMDPWWNPAVEDQAADRAHRMGQQRPVTIYRLVAQNTIEEKIVKLHHQKRDLADSLLEGSETAAKLSPDDLMKLIKEI